MLSFAPSIKLEMEMKRLQGLIVESYKSLESISSEESRYLNRFAFISIIGASTRIENAVLTDREIEWVDTILNNDGRISAFYFGHSSFRGPVFVRYNTLSGH